MSSVASERGLHIQYFAALKAAYIHLLKKHREAQSSTCTTQGKTFAKYNLKKEYRLKPNRRNTIELNFACV